MNSILLFGMPGTPEWIILIVMGLLPMVSIVDIMNSSFRGMNAKWVWYWIGREQRVIS